MSSPSQPRRDRRAARVVALLLVTILGQCCGLPPAAAAVPVPVVAVIPGTAQTSLVVDLGSGAATVRPEAASVTLDGAPQQTRLTPVVSERLTVALVVDTSRAGSAALPAWLSAAARFVLEAPAGTRAGAVADTTPPAVIAAPQRGPMGIVAALSAVRAGGDRSTSDALTLAGRQFPATATAPLVIVLYTSSADAGGESAAALAARLRQAAAMLVVVGTAQDSAYWSSTARATGGFFAPVGTPVVVPALDQVATTLRSRYLVSFPTPARLPARVSVRIGAGDVALTGEAVIRADGSSGADARPSRPASGLPAGSGRVLLAGCVLVLIAAAVLLVRGRVARLAASTRDGPPRAEPASWVALGRAPVPGAVAQDDTTPDLVTPPSAAPPGTVAPRGAAGPGAAARGRASVPGTRPPPPAR